MIVILKLNNGTEIVGELVDEKPASITLRKPFQINYKYFYGPLPSMSLAKYMMFADNDTFSFMKDTFINRVEARKPFAEFYLLTSSTYDTDIAEKIDDELRANVDTRTASANSGEQNLKTFLENVSHEDMVMN